MFLTLLTALDIINFCHIYQGLRIGLEKKMFSQFGCTFLLTPPASGVKSPHCLFAFLLVRIDFHSFYSFLLAAQQGMWNCCDQESNQYPLQWKLRVLIQFLHLLFRSSLYTRDIFHSLESPR